MRLTKICRALLRPPASLDLNSEMHFEKEPRLRTTVHYLSDESKPNFGSDESNDEEEPLIRANKAKTNSGSAPSQDASLAPTPTSSWRNAGAKKNILSNIQPDNKSIKSENSELSVEADIDTPPISTNARSGHKANYLGCPRAPKKYPLPNRNSKDNITLRPIRPRRIERSRAVSKKYFIRQCNSRSPHVRVGLAHEGFRKRQKNHVCCMDGSPVKAQRAAMLPAHSLARPPTDSSDNSVYILGALLKFQNLLVKSKAPKPFHFTAHIVIVHCVGLVEICRVDAMMLD
ncbi:hypothetical protein EVAR_25780_1 [Eumeta japonica]|uniref:Uncharacterized protein n=1 Tax=Eumeta variegata TaxID=151549 RepID=A0A4C1VWF3_EUMVA|nr:hypothetical protein EVAR_25780_1 [Eumeta japonica]